MKREIASHTLVVTVSCHYEERSDEVIFEIATATPHGDEKKPPPCGDGTGEEVKSEKVIRNP